MRLSLLLFLFLSNTLLVALELTTQETEWIKQNREVPFTGDPNWLPYEAFSEDGKYIGIVAEHLSMIENISGLKFKPVSASSWSQSLDIAIKGDVKIISGDAADDILNKKFNPVRSYSKNPIVIIMRDKNNYVEKLEHIADKKIAIIKDYGYTSEIFKTYPNIKFIEVDNIQDGLNGLSQGKFDAMLATMALASYTIAQMNIHNLKIVGKTSVVMDLTFFISKDEPILFNIIEKSLLSISDEDKHKILQNWVQQKYVERVDYTWAVVITLFLMTIIVIILYWTFKLKSEIDKRLLAEEKLLESEKKYKNIFKSNGAIELIINPLDKKIIDANDSALKFYGYGYDEIKALYISDINILSDEEILKEMESAKNKHRKMFRFKHKLFSGEIRDVEVYSSPVSIDKKVLLYSIIFDITHRVKLEKLVKLRHELLDLVYQGDNDKLLRYALDMAESLTNSQIGFFHFVEKDQENISLQVWSTNTLQKMCFAEGMSTHYPISKAGVWVDCIHQRQPVIHNDYESLLHKKGLPEGHSPLVRELTVPIMRGELIVGVVGVGNKEQDYNEEDVKIVQQIADTAYDYSERLQAENKIEFMAYYDTLTALPNRSLLADRMNQAIAIHRRSKQFLAVCFIDLDGFKPVNDQYGHHIGDKLLVELSKRLQEHLRDGDTLSRIGGDEFVLVITALATSDGYKEVVERVLETVNKPFVIESYRIHISASIGVTIFPIDNRGADELLRHADQAMYEAKEDGKSKYKLYQYIKDENDKLNKEIVDEFSYALKNEQLILYYQPKVNLKDGAIIGFEALIRWKHPEKGVLLPYKFLPLIENTPLEIELDEWVLTHALAQKVEFDKLGFQFSLSININPRFIQDHEFVEFLSAALSIYPADFAKGVEIEILEISSIEDTKRVSIIMNECKELGIKFSLDDFGTGYASLSHLHELPIDILKIDQKFVKDMLIDKNDLDIVEGVLKLANTLRRPVIAEGVESIEIGLMLLSLGCDYAQGYSIARPMPKEDVEHWVTEWNKRSLWFELKDKVSLDMSSYDLDVAIFSHKKWLDDVIDYVSDYKTDKNVPTSETECQFGKWYKGVGRSKYGDRESYAFVQAEHNRAHAVATALIKLAKSGKKVKAKEGIDELKKQASRLIDLLHRLAAQ